MTLSKNKGFSLLEVLVAFSLFALTIGALLQIFVGSRHAVIRSEAYTQAAIIADSQLARVGIEFEIEDMQEEGESETGFTWRIKISPFEIESDLPTAYETWLVQVDVNWDQNVEKPSHFSLNTLRLTKKRF